MAAVSYRRFSGNAAENYQRDFVPAIGRPSSGELVRAAGLQPGERVLDLACGTGLITRLAAEQVGPSGSVTGLDITPEMLAVASVEPAPPGAAPIDWRLGDACALELPDQSYDVVVCQLGLMFMADRAAALAEMRRVLVTGGRLAVSTGGRIQPVFEVLRQVITDHISPELGAFVPVVFSLHDPETVAELARTAGFHDVAARTYEVDLQLPPPAEFLWLYVNLTPMGALVAQAPEPARAAMEADFVAATTPAHTTPTGATQVRQPLVLATGRA
jgi:ubiquinone/menaquinone biosynthesis C-methylase UbiE